MNYFRLSSIILFFVLFSGVLFAQPEEKLSAKEYFAEQDYNQALVEYLKLYKANKTDVEMNFNIGICYLNINDDRSKALPYFEFVISKDKNREELCFYIAQAYAYAYKFDDAIKYYNEYKKKLNPKRHEEINRFIENCENGKELIKKPVNVSFENLGKEINSKFPDYYPFVTEDQSSLYYTTRREGRSRLRSWQGYYTSDVYVSKVVAGQWAKPKTIGTMINTSEDEQCVYITPNGKRMVLYIDNETSTGDLYYTEYNPKTKAFPRPTLLENPVNTPGLELEGCITEDGYMMIVASDRPDGLGETDLYMFKKLPNGTWGDAVNLGPNVNTKYKESFPVYDEKNRVLYFASEGHNSMGGSDIFKSKYDEATQGFEPAVNIGYPINTPEENLEFTLAGNHRDGYISAVRPEGYGDLDIYKVVFNDVDEQVSIIKGIVSTTDSTAKEIVATITLINAKTNEKIDSKDVNPKSGKYVFSANPGKYILNVTSNGFEEAKEPLNVYDKSDFVFEIEKNIKLYKPGENPATKEPAPKPGVVKPGAIAPKKK